MNCTIFAILVAGFVLALFGGIFYLMYRSDTRCSIHGKKSRYWANCPYAEGWEYVCLECHPDDSRFKRAGTKEHA